MVLEAFHEGADADKSLSNVDRYVPADVAVVFGVFKKSVPASYARGEIIRRQQEAGGKVVVLETGYINRGDGPDHHYAAGIGGLNNRADFRNVNMPGDRWEKLRTPIKPWRQGDAMVICGQVPWDASVQHIDMVEWLEMSAGYLRRSAVGKPLVYRPHPLAREHPARLDGFVTSVGPIEDDLARAFCFVTYNSNAAVEAVLNGVPAVHCDEGSMAREVSSFDVPASLNPVMPDRTQWACNLAYTQWTPEEMRRGATWRHLFGNG